MTNEIMLDKVRIASPCTASWDSMEGDDRARFCRSCSKHVYNFSAMNSDEVTQLIKRNEGKLCARFYRRRDGTMLTADCPTGRKRQRRRDFFGLCLGVLGLGAAYWGMATATGGVGNGSSYSVTFLQRMESKIKMVFSSGLKRPVTGQTAIMGDVCYPPP